MTTKLHHKQRLLKLVKHLIRGNLYHEKFDFNTFSATTCSPTCGCAMGEAWFMWANFFKGKTDFCVLREFFDLQTDEFMNLFWPDFEGTPNRHRYNNISLGKEATKEQVAANILAF